MLAASQKQFDLLLFWKLDRLSREGVRMTLTYLERLDSWGVAWRSYMEPYLDSCGAMKGCCPVHSWRAWHSRNASASANGQKQGYGEQ